jgi:hypothetical protein
VSKLIDLTGLRFECLVVRERAENTKGGQARWTCICDCGETKVVQASNLRSGHTTSCGCVARERRSIRMRMFMTGSGINVTHGHSKKHQRTPTYNSWRAMRQRCLDPNMNRYGRYGGLGVTICERWSSFGHFLADLGERPLGTTLGRFGDVGDYTPTNCKWMTSKEQRANWSLDRNLGACRPRMAA